MGWIYENWRIVFFAIAAVVLFILEKRQSSEARKTMVDIELTKEVGKTTEEAEEDLVVCKGYFIGLRKDLEQQNSNVKKLKMINDCYKNYLNAKRTH